MYAYRAFYYNIIIFFISVYSNACSSLRHIIQTDQKKFENGTST